MPEATAPLLEPQFLARLEQLELVSRKIFHGRTKGERRSKRKGQSVEFADFRPYVVGDDLRFLDWNLFARLEHLFLRLFMEEEDLVLASPLVNAKGEWTTTWMLKLSFPVFLRNVLYELGRIEDTAAAENTRPGEVRTIRPPASVASTEVTRPDGARESVRRGAGGEFLYNSTERAGIYGVSWPGGEQRFAVNLLDADESNLQPRDEVLLGSQGLADAPPRRQSHELWKWGVAVALVLLALEWAAYHRRSFFRT